MISSVRSVAAALFVCALAVSACGPKQPETKPAPPPPPVETPKPTTPPAPPAPTPPPPATPTKPLTEDEIWEKMTPDEATKAGLLKPVYFAYDSIALSEDARGVLQKNADF